MSRPSWDEYFMSMAHLASRRATCDRKHVGAILVREKQVLATGYNGALPGEPHCDEAGHDLVKLFDGSENCVRTQHAESNVVAQAAKHGIVTAGGTVYVNTYPCWPCMRLLIAAGVKEVVFDAEYRNDPRVDRAAKAAGVLLRRYCPSLPTG